MEPMGILPKTRLDVSLYRLLNTTNRSQRSAVAEHGIGGAEEDRTPDLLRARQALSQLSYGPWRWQLAWHTA
jgi:hypothetical protein